MARSTISQRDLFALIDAALEGPEQLRTAYVRQEHQDACHAAALATKERLAAEADLHAAFDRGELVWNADDVITYAS